MPSLKKNFIYSSILTCANYIFPLLTYPYVARVLGVDNIGIYNFADSIISYFLLFSSMGINSVGIREIAKAKGDKAALNVAYSSLFTLVFISTLIAAVVLLFVTEFVPQLHVHKELMYIGTIRLFASTCQVEWLFKGLEEFKYITKRSIMTKCFYVASVFFFVKNSDDYDIYFALYTLMVLFNAVINCTHSRRYVSWLFTNLKIKQYVKPFLVLGVYMLLTSMYTSFNVVYLGFVAGERQVGFYSTAAKLYTIFLSLYTAFTGVMLPRMSSLLGKGNLVEFKQYINKSQNVLFSFSIPLMAYAIIFAPQIIMLLSGPGYEGAILPMRIIFSLMLVCGYEQILVIQTLMPLKQDKAILCNSILGCFVGLALNIFLVSNFQSVGSAIVWLCSEISVLIASQIVVMKKLQLNFPFKLVFFYLIGYLPLALCLEVIHNLCEGVWQSIILGGIFLFCYVFVVKVFIQHDPILLNLIKIIKRRS